MVAGFLRANFLLIFFLFFLFFLCSNSYSQNSLKNQINNVGLAKFGDIYKITFESDKKLTYKIFTLKNPDRLVIDFEKADFNAKVDIYEKSALFDSFRNAKRNQNDVRAVFVLKKPIKVSKSTILQPSSDNKNYRLIIELSIGDVKEENNKKYSLSPLSSEIADNILKEPKAVSKKKVAKQSYSKKKIIVIDAGHGGKDPGAIGRYAKTKEKKVTLSFAKEIKRYLDKTGKFKVYLTRDKDYFITLGGRVKKSQKLKADLFISVHADSAENRKARGLSIYTLSETSSDKEAAKLARRENKSDIIGGANFSGATGDILKTLISLSQRSTMNSSAHFAEFAIKEMSKNKIQVKHNSHRFAGFRVLTAPDVPSVLIELGYLSNKYDEKKLNSSYYRKKFSKVLAKIVEEYFK